MLLLLLFSALSFTVCARTWRFVYMRVCMRAREGVQILFIGRRQHALTTARGKSFYGA